MTPLDHSLTRSVLICATRSMVFRFFTDPALFADWWGAGSSIEGWPGGAVAIRYPNGVVASGTVLEVVNGERIVFTFGYEAADKPIPPGGSRVTVTLRDHPAGTAVELRHDLADPAARDQHVLGWSYQLALFAVVAARAQHGDGAAGADPASRWRAAPLPGHRTGRLGRGRRRRRRARARDERIRSGPGRPDGADRRVLVELSQGSPRLARGSGMRTVSRPYSVNPAST